LFVTENHCPLRLVIGQSKISREVKTIDNLNLVFFFPVEEPDESRTSSFATLNWSIINKNENYCYHEYVHFL